MTSVDHVTFQLISWFLLVIGASVACVAVVCGIRFTYQLHKNVSAKLFKIPAVITTSLLTLNCIAVSVNFFAIVYTNWKSVQLLNYLSIPWRILYTLSCLAVVFIFVIRLHQVFKGTIYAFSNILYIGLIISIIIGASSAIIGTYNFRNIRTCKSCCCKLFGINWNNCLYCFIISHGWSFCSWSL